MTACFRAPSPEWLLPCEAITFNAYPYYWLEGPVLCNGRYKLKRLWAS
jgi:hypothetical protein